MTTEELLACLTVRGLNTVDMDNLTIGMCLNFIRSYDRFDTVRKGGKWEDPETAYKIAKKALPIVERRYKEGVISEEEYRSYVSEIEEYERG